MNVSRCTVFVFSLEPWGNMWYSKHHYAAELAKTHRVNFISPPDRWRLSDLFSFRLKTRTTLEGVNIVEYRNNLPLRLLPSSIRNLMEQFTAWKFRRMLDPEGNIFWCFHPTTIVDRSILHKYGHRTIYHVVDPYQTFPDDPRTAKNADLVVAINPWFQEHYTQRNANTILIPHGVRGKDRQHEPVRAAHYAKRWGRYAVMAAGINNRTNYNLLAALADALPELKLVLVGPLAALEDKLGQQRDRLLKLPNVVHVGVQHPDELRHIIRGAVIGLVAYAFESRQEADRSPSGSLKILSYLAQGRPVVSSINSFLPALSDRGVYKAENDADFIKIVSEVLEGKLSIDENAVETYLDQITYDQLTSAILRSLPPKMGDQAVARSK